MDNKLEFTKLDIFDIIKIWTDVECLNYDIKEMSCEQRLEGYTSLKNRMKKTFE